MTKLNCWEFKKCGRESGGAKEKDLGTCRATAETKLNTVNSGNNAGRACWAVSGTLCGGKVQGSFAEKLGNCLSCEFYQLVVKEEGSTLKGSREILKILS